MLLSNNIIIAAGIYCYFTMHTSKLFLVFLAATLLLFGCKRDSLSSADQNTPSEQNIDIKDLAVPTGFNFSSEKSLLVRVKVADATPNEKYIIKIYGDEPTTGKLISTGVTNTSAEYSNTITLPTATEYIYIEKIESNGNSKFEKVTANQFANVLFGSTQSAKPYILRKSSGMNCNTGCTVTYNNPSSNVSLTVGNNSVVKICASGTIDTLKILNNSVINVLENTTIKINTVSIDPFDSYSLYNWSDSLVINATIYPYKLINHGKCYVENYSCYYPSTNFGTFVIQTDFTLGNFESFHNHGKLKIGRNLSVSRLCGFVNFCYVEVGGDVNQNGSITIRDNAYLKVKGAFYDNGNIHGWPVTTTLYTNSLLSTTHFFMKQGTFNGPGVIKVSDYTSLTAGGTISSSTKLCDANGIEGNTGVVVNSSSLDCSISIPKSTCNPEGFNITTTSVDSDNDGIVDAQDEYPNDINRAFNSYYPNATTMATVAFEDLWPSKADYDFNDLSVLFNIQQVLNASNEVVDYKVKLKVKAIGGSFINGFGFQLDDVLPADIASLTGQTLTQNLITRNANNTESGQSKAVVICYDSPEPIINRVGGSMFNTIKTNPTGTSDTMHIDISFTNPIASTKLTLNKFNPFIFTNKRRGYEVHLIDNKPTDLANTGLFGTFEDRSNASNNKYYRNNLGLPWAIRIPQEFSHPKEKVAISTAYNFFDDWAISGGVNFPLWFTNTVGNQNTENIY